MTASSAQLSDVSVEIDARLRELPLFAEAPEKAIAAVAEVAERRLYAPGETVYAIGQYDGEEAIFVVDGAVNATYPDRSQGAVIMESWSAGRIFGADAAVIEETPPGAIALTVVAETAAEIITVPCDALRSIIAQRPSLTRLFMLHFARMLHERPVALEPDQPTPERKIIDRLATLAEHDPLGGFWRIARMPKHRELAGETDTDETTVANVVAGLIHKGVARRDYPGLIISDMRKLENMVK
ncbi:MAG: Crp/Fnr family transcriptional regulator [Pseudomonadota bacterium]